MNNRNHDGVVKEPVEKSVNGADVASGNFQFERKADGLPTFLQLPGVSSISKTNEALPTSIPAKNKENQDNMNTETKTLVKFSKETHNLTKKEKSVEEVPLAENQERARIFYLLLPLLMLLVAFVCLLCILTVLVC